MKFINNLLCWLPLLASAQSISEAFAEHYTEDDYRLSDAEIAALNITMTTPEIGQMRAAYPDVDWTDGVFGLDWTDGVSGIESANTTLAKRVTPARLGFRFVVGGLTVTGYFSLYKGADQVLDWRQSCRDYEKSGDPYDSDACFVKGLKALGAHLFVGGVAFAGGKEFLTLLWTSAKQAVVDQITGGVRRWLGGPSQHARRDTCDANPQTYNSPVYYTDSVSLKAAVKDTICASTTIPELGYIDAGMGKIGPAMITAGSPLAQFTFFRTSDETILGRCVVKLDGQVQELCYEDITGGDDCKCTDC